jgi:hypothetical protein
MVCVHISLWVNELVGRRILISGVGLNVYIMAGNCGDNNLDVFYCNSPWLLMGCQIVMQCYKVDMFVCIVKNTVVQLFWNLRLMVYTGWSLDIKLNWSRFSSGSVRQLTSNRKGSRIVFHEVPHINICVNE